MCAHAGTGLIRILPALRQRVEEALNRLEQETYISAMASTTNT